MIAAGAATRATMTAGTRKRAAMATAIKAKVTATKGAVIAIMEITTAEEVITTTAMTATAAQIKMEAKAMKATMTAAMVKVATVVAITVGILAAVMVPGMVIRVAVLTVAGAISTMALLALWLVA
jgi:hypothetical protein